jgi:hypothetical protein
LIEGFLDANPGAVAQAALWCADDAPEAGEPPVSAGLVALLPALPVSDFMCRTGQSADGCPAQSRCDVATRSTTVPENEVRSGMTVPKG